MKKGLVSILTPCYNGEKFLTKYFESILNQTYKNIELILVNDGSKDNTDKIVKKYKEIFEKNNIRFIYEIQENAGPAVAINKGLPYVEGEFLVWPDADDFYENNAIEKMASYLISNPNKDYVRCKIAIRNDSSLDKIQEIRGPENKEEEDLFENYLLAKDVYGFAGVIMIRMEQFDESVKNRKIVEDPFGQNWQMILPVVHNRKAGFIDEPLYNIRVRSDSLSRNSIKTLDDEFKKIERYKEISEKVLKQMNLYEEYKNMLDEHYNIQKMKASFSYFDREKTIYYGNLVKNKRKFNKLEKMEFLVMKNLLLYFVYRIYRKIKYMKK